MTDMHVLFVIDSLAASGGAEQALAAATPALITRGITCTVQPIQARPGLAQRLAESGALVLPPLPGGRARQLLTLASRIRATGPDLVHTTLFESDILGRPAARLAGKAVVSSLVNVAYGADQRHNVTPAKVAAARRLDMASARLAVRFHALTHHVRDEMGRRLHIPSRKIDVIPRGRDPKLLGKRSASRRAKARAALGIRPEQVLIVSAARHEYQKGLDVALRAVAQVAADGRDVVYVIAGRCGNETATLTNLVGTLGLSRRVQLLGVREDVAELFAAADLALIPSRWEGLGSAIIEAMALEAPLVVSDIPAIRETVGGPAQAVLVPPDCVDALAACVLEVLSDEEGSRRRAMSAVRRFHEHFTLDSVVEETIRFYDRAMDSRQSASLPPAMT